MTDPPGDDVGPARGARAAAVRLAPEFGAGLPADVEAALHESSGGDRYLDPVAVASLVISAAQFAWTIYIDLKKKSAKPSREVLARRVRVELADRTELEAGVRDRVIDVVVAETVPDVE